MRRSLAFAALAVALALAIPARAESAAAKVTALLRSCEGSSAQFVHKFLPNGYKKETVERGSVVFGKLPEMRWSYTSPEAKEFVFDGTTSWLWVPADRQVTVHDLAADERAALPFFALSDAGRVERDFTVSRSGAKTTLKPRGKGGLFREIVVQAGADGRLAALRYVDTHGNSTSFEFATFAPAKRGPETFRFVPPAGADVIRN